MQSHQDQLEIFDGNVAHISTWLYQAEALLDEIEKKPASKQEEIVKVANVEDQLHFRERKVLLSSFVLRNVPRYLFTHCSHAVDSLTFISVGATSLG